MKKIQIQIPSVKLSSGYDIPVLGYGTSRTAGQSADLYNALKFAIEIGYRHIDTAWIYHNEHVISKVISECIDHGLVKREDLFITSKLWNTFHSREMAKLGLHTTMKNLSVDYLDMFLMHSPMAFKDDNTEGYPLDDEGNLLFSDVHFLETYHVMEEFVDAGLVRSIGVTNFNIEQLEQLLKECRIKPAMIELECNPYIHNEKLIQFCQNNGITVCAYGSLGAFDLAVVKGNVPILLDDPNLIRIGNKYSKTSAQVCLRWALQRGLIAIPKSLVPEQILENAQVFDFELSDQDMQEIKKLDQNIRIYTAADQKKHPFYPYKE